MAERGEVVEVLVIEEFIAVFGWNVAEVARTPLVKGERRTAVEGSKLSGVVVSFVLGLCERP